jgi:hypothetical protein
MKKSFFSRRLLDAVMTEPAGRFQFMDGYLSPRLEILQEGGFKERISEISEISERI